jgi:hypothetical protein
VALEKRYHVTHTYAGGCVPLLGELGMMRKLRSKPNDCAEMVFLNLKDNASRSYIIQVILAIDPASSVHRAQPFTRLTRKFKPSRCVWAWKIWKCIGHNKAQSYVSSTDFSYLRPDQADSGLDRPVWLWLRSALSFISRRPGPYECKRQTVKEHGPSSTT